MSKLSILHLVGSAYNDFYCNLSRLYAQDCLAAIADQSSYDFQIAYITPDLLWRFPPSLSPEDIAVTKPIPLFEAIQFLTTQNIDKDNIKAWIVDTKDPVTEKVQAVAKKCHQALGCRHYSLFDFRIDPNEEPWFLEAGLYCSFAPKSVISSMAKAARISLNELLITAINETLGNKKALSNCS